MSSNTSKIAAMAALSMVLTPASAPLAKTEDGSPRDGAKITASINLETDEVFYSEIPDEALEIMATIQLSRNDVRMPETNLRTVRAEKPRGK